MLRKAMNHYSLSSVKYKKCCKGKCTEPISQHVIKGCRYRYWSLNKLQRTEWLFDRIRDAYTPGKRLKFPIANRKIVCATAFRLIHNIDKNTFSKKLKAYKDGAISGGMHSHRQISEKYLAALDWLEEYAEYHADKMPHVAELWLPHRTRKVDLYQKYCNEMTENNTNDVIAQSTFFQMWKKRFPHLKVKQVNIFKCKIITI
jgi:hypothetical protein